MVRPLCRCCCVPRTNTRAAGAEVKEENSLAMVTCQPIAVQRAPVLSCLTVPLKGVSDQARQPYKLPAGTTYTSESSELKKRKTFGARMALCRWGDPARGRSPPPHPLPCGNEGNRAGTGCRPLLRR